MNPAMDTTIDEPTLAQIEKELDRDGVWVAPDLNQVTKADEAEIEAAVAKAPTPTYVVLADISIDDQLTGGDPAQLASVIRDDTGRQGTYIGLQPIYDKPRLEITAFPDDSSLFYASSIAEIKHPRDITAQTLTSLDLLASDKDLPLMLDRLERTQEQSTTETPASESASGDDGTDVVPWILGGGLLLILFWTLIGITRLVRGRRSRYIAPTDDARAGRSFSLPAAVLVTVRAAEDQRRQEQAEADVLSLGEAIQNTDLDADASASGASWQAALDHYDFASRILDRKHSPADVVGAIVLARRGRSALDAAVRGRAWKPAAPCYPNPLHGDSSAKVTWRNGESKVRVPVCNDCAADIKRGQDPEDVLDFLDDGTPRRYFTLDLGAWSATGFGALDPNLIDRLRAGK